jgi:hypothetical protein
MIRSGADADRRVELGQLAGLPRVAGLPPVTCDYRRSFLPDSYASIESNGRFATLCPKIGNYNVAYLHPLVVLTTCS